MRRGIGLLAAALALGGVLHPSVAAESATLDIVVHDEHGQPVADARVELAGGSDVPLVPPVQTGPEGKVSLSVHGGAGYTVHVSCAKFIAQSSEPFDLFPGAKRSLLVKLQPQVVENVRVRAGVIELDEGGEQKLTFAKDLFEDLPILGRSYQSVLTLAPGVNDANRDGNPNVHGARERDFKATLDGVSNVDPLTGTYMSEVNADAIDEIEVVTTGAPAEYGGATGGFGRIVTKQGTNVFAGTAGAYLRSSFFDGGTINSGTDSQPARYHDVRPILNFTGPIVKDKLFFALFHEYVDQGLPVNLVSGQGLVVVTQGSRNLDKLTWQLNPRNKLTFQVQTDPLRTGPLGIDSATAPESGYDATHGGPGYQVRWDFQHSSTLLLQTLVGASHTGVSFIPQTSNVKNGCGIDLDAMAFPSTRHDIYGHPNGPPMDEDYCFEESSAQRRGSYYRNYSDDRIRYTFKSDASYFLQSFLGTDHTIRGGVIAERKVYSGQQSLKPVSDWKEDPPTLSNGGEIGGGVIARTVYVPGYPDHATNASEGSNYGAYIEDQFRPHPNLSIRLGVRVDQENLAADGFSHFDPAQEDRAFTKSYEDCVRGSPSRDRCARASWHVFHVYEIFPAIGASPVAPIMSDPGTGVQRRQPERFRISNTNLAPRLSVSWDPGTQGRGKIFGTAGRYYGEIFLAVPAFEQGPDSFVYRYPVDGYEVNCHGVPNDPNALDCDHVSLIGPDSSAQVAAPSIRQVDRNLRTPYQDEYTAGLSWELFRETSLTLTGIRREFRDQLQDVDLNHYPVVYVDPHTHIRYHLDTFYDPFFNEVLRVGNFNASDYKALQLDLHRRLSSNWEMEASYVRSKATGNGEDYDQTLGNDPNLVEDEFGYLDYDQTHVLKLNVRTLIPQWNLRLSTAASWQTGRPYSIVQQGVVFDLPRRFGGTEFGYQQLRTSFPTHQRNDQRNEAYANIDVGMRKDFALGKTSLEASVDVFNLLNDSALFIQEVRNGQLVGTRNTGRQFQVGAKIAF